MGSYKNGLGSAAETGPPEVIDFSESNDANVAVNLDVTDTRQLLIYALGHWVYTFTDVATPIGYNGTWLDAGGNTLYMLILLILSVVVELNG